MEYTILKLAKIAGVSSRTLRYYDEINLLKPLRINTSGYRIYGTNEVDLLQQIMVYRELGMKLEDIRKILVEKDFDENRALEKHLQDIKEKRLQLDKLIKNIEKTILSKKGESEMSDSEKFLGLKRSSIDENEEKYGEEIRERYGNEKVSESNKKFMNLKEKEYEEMNRIGEEINGLLEEAIENNKDYRDEVGENIAKLHKKWLTFTWVSYSKEAHIGLVNMYISDERFTQYYDKNVEGCALFLKNAVEYHI